jgi:hypothetical protein
MSCNITLRPVKDRTCDLGIPDSRHLALPNIAEYYCSTIGLVVLPLRWLHGNSGRFRVTAGE